MKSTVVLLCAAIDCPSYVCQYVVRVVRYSGVRVVQSCCTRTHEVATRKYARGDGETNESEILHCYILLYCHRPTLSVSPSAGSHCSLPFHPSPLTTPLPPPLAALSSAFTTRLQPTMSRSPPHPPPPLASHPVIHYPESEFEHSHSRSPSIATVTLSPIPASRSLPPSPPFNSSVGFNAPPIPFVSLSSIPPEPADAMPSSIAPLAASIDAEELTRQSLGGSSRTASPRLPHSSLETNNMHPSHSTTASSAPLSSSSLHLSSSLASGGSTAVGGSSGYYDEVTPLSFAGGSNGLSSTSHAVLDPLVASIIDTTRTLAAQHQLPAALSPSSHTATPAQSITDASASPITHNSSYDQVAVVYSAGLLQLSQRLKELHHPLSARVMLAVGAAGGQMKAADYPASLATCQRALSTLESWPSLSSLTVKEAMLRLFKQFKQSFTSNDALQARLLYVEFFLTLSALLAAEHREWSLALQHSAQKGLKGQAAEAVRSMTKIVKLLFTAGLSKPPSAYRRKVAGGSSGGVGGRGERGEGGRRERRGEGAEDEGGEEKHVDWREREVQHAVRMLAWRRSTDNSSSTGASDADGEEKRLNVDDVDLLFCVLGVESDLSNTERQQQTLYRQHDIVTRMQQLPYQPASTLNLTMQQLIRPSQPKPQTPSSHSSSLASLSLHSPSIRIPSAIPSSVPRHHSSRATTPLSTQRQLKFHAASSSSPVGAAAHGRVMSFGGGGGGGEVGGGGGGEGGMLPHVQPLLQLVKANKRDEVFRLLLSINDSDEKDEG